MVRAGRTQHLLVSLSGDHASKTLAVTFYHVALRSRMSASRLHRIAHIEYGQEKRKIKIRRPASKEDIEEAIRAAFGLDGGKRVLLSEKKEGVAVVIDDTLETTEYLLKTY
eukprot:g7800.t1